MWATTAGSHGDLLCFHEAVRGLAMRDGPASDKPLLHSFRCGNNARAITTVRATTGAFFFEALSGLLTRKNKSPASRAFQFRRFWMAARCAVQRLFMGFLPISR